MMMRMLAQAVDHTPAWLAFTGAVIVAAVAALTAQWRQRVEMRHDRQMHDLGELRSLLDECAQVVAVGSERLLKFSNLLAHTALGTPSSTVGSDSELRRLVLEDATSIEIGGPFESVDEAGHAILAGTAPLFGLYQRVVLRLGQNHSVSLALLSVQEICATSPLKAMEINELRLDQSDRWQRITAWQEEMREAHFTFLAACHYLVRSRVAGDTPH